MRNNTYPLLKTEQGLINDFRRFITLLLAISVAGTVILQESTHSVVLTIIMALASTFVVLVYARMTTGTFSASSATGDSIASLLPAAIAAELILALYESTNLGAQILFTTIVGILLFCASEPPYAHEVSKEDDPQVPRWFSRMPNINTGHTRPTLQSFYKLANSILYQANHNLKYYWLAVRVLIFTVSYSDGTKKLWFGAQLILVVCVMFLATNNAAFDSNGNKLGVRTYFSVAAVSVVCFMYAFEHVIPTRASLIGIALPIMYVANQSIPSAEGNNPNMFRSIATFLIVTALLLYSLTFSNNVYNDSLGRSNLQGSTNCPSLLNLDECHEGVKITVGNCCCKNNHVPFQILHGTSHYGCIPVGACQSKALRTHQQSVPIDCCGVALTEGSKRLVAGRYLCVCNNAPGNIKNTVTKEGTCKCAKGLTGKYCTEFIT